MREFVSLDNCENEGLEVKKQIVLKSILSLQDECNVIEVNIKEIESVPLEEELCVKDCDHSQFIGCQTEDGSFKVDNLFSELTTDFQRALARLNLGIGDESTLEWGNIKGNIGRLQDLLLLLKQYLANKADKDELNAKADKSDLDLKANIVSPSFSGIVTAPNPSYEDNSNLVATTNWVLELLKNFEGGGSGTASVFTQYSLSPTWAYKDLSNVSVTLSWSYRKNIKSLKLNGLILSNDIKQFKEVLNSNKTYTLECFYDEDGYEKKVASFAFYYANYYGTVDNYTLLSKTTGTKFVIDCSTDKHAYIIIPNNASARFSVNGFVGGFKMVSSLQLFGATYYTYMSTYSGLGKITVELLG